MKDFTFEMPDHKQFEPYRVNIAMGFLYTLGFGSLLLWIGERYAALILLVPLFFFSTFVNIPLYFEEGQDKFSR